MHIIYYPNKSTVDIAKSENDILLMIVSHNADLLILSSVDDVYDFPVLTKPDGLSEYGNDKFFRIILTQEEADWTFICPKSYKGGVAHIWGNHTSSFPK